MSLGRSSTCYSVFPFSSFFPSFPSHYISFWNGLLVHARMAEILFTVLSHLNGMSGHLPHVGYSQTEETSWKRSGDWSAETSQEMFWAFIVLGCLGQNLAEYGLLLRPPIWSFAAASVEIRHKIFGAGCEFQLEITAISYNKRHLRWF